MKEFYVYFFNEVEKLNKDEIITASILSHLILKAERKREEDAKPLKDFEDSH